MTVQMMSWQETFKHIIRLSISEQLEILVALAKRFGIGNNVPVDLDESDYVDHKVETHEYIEAEAEGNLLKDNAATYTNQPGSQLTLSSKFGHGEPYSFFKVASTLNLDGPPDWSENVDAYLYGGKSLDAS